MKKAMSLVLSLLLSLGVSATALAAGAAPVEETTTQVLESADGDVVTITTTVYQQESLRGGTARKSASKRYVYTSGGSDRWSYTLYASFDSDGMATDASDIYSIYDSDWDLDSNDTYTSGNTAYGEANFSSPSDRESAELSLTCDRYGNIE